MLFQITIIWYFKARTIIKGLRQNITLSYNNEDINYEYSTGFHREISVWGGGGGVENVSDQVINLSNRGFSSYLTNT